MNNKKGVICRVEDPANMPVDDDGNRADIISGPDSVPGRMNLGRLYDPYFAGAARDVRRQILEELGFDRHFKGQLRLTDMNKIPASKYKQGVNTLMKYYSITSERTYHEFTQVLTDDERQQWVMGIINEALYNYFPIEMTRSFDDIALDIEANFKLTYGPVTYIGRNGEKIRTKNSFRIAPMMTMLLDKIADTWLSVSTGKHSNFGILAPMNQADKYETPWRNTSPRLIGETEGRLNAAVNGPEMIAEQMDRYGNIASQREIVNNILHAENPSQISNIIDREKIPLGSARPIQIVQHLFRCTGVEVVFVPEQL